ATPIAKAPIDVAANVVEEAFAAIDDTTPAAKIGEPISVGVLVPDFEDVRDSGLVPNLTVAQYADRWRAEAAQLNGAEELAHPLDIIPISWDPLTPESAEQACQQAEELEVFVVATAANFPEHQYRCFTDAGRPVVTANAVSETRFDLSRGLLFSVQPPREQLARSGARRLADEGLLNGTLGVIGNDQSGDKAAAETVASSLRGLGYTVELELVPTTEGIVAVRQTAGDIIDRLDAADVGTIVFASNSTVAGELAPYLAQAGWPVHAIDVDGLVDPYAAERLGAPWEGTLVVTAQAPTTLPSSIFEDRCRATFELFQNGMFSEGPIGDWSATGGRTTRGALEDSINPPGDIGYDECTITRVLAAAMDQVGAEPTAADFVEAMETLPDPIEIAGNRAGMLGPNRHWMANHMMMVRLGVDLACPPGRQACWISTTGDRSDFEPIRSGAALDSTAARIGEADIKTEPTTERTTPTSPGAAPPPSTTQATPASD
ncbi:MAG: hypothetical protein HKN26_16835, partial [Acidimicrobiales bacterium]|nr:hypothetical protein [Acidimicrobiales bacterium]